MPHLSDMEVSLRIPLTALFKEDSLMLIINDNKYGEEVPVQLATTGIDKATGIITPQELNNPSKNLEMDTP